MKLKQASILIVLVLTSIVILKSCDYRLWMLKSRELTYSELPKEVQIFLEERTKYGERVTLLCVNAVDTVFYQTEKVRHPIVSAWFLYTKLIDKKNDKCYRIPRDVPRPYTIYKNKLYTPNLYNIILGGDDFRKAIYTEYELK